MLPVDICLRAGGEDEKDDGCGVKAGGRKWVNFLDGLPNPNSKLRDIYWRGNCGFVGNLNVQIFPQ